MEAMLYFRIPEDHVVSQGKDQGCRLRVLGEVYTGGRKNTPPPKRFCIGKKDPSAPSFINPNSNFMLYFPREAIPEE